ncbi:MarR family transcriptional regulator [Aerococcaceae bacterium zg-BR9]|uniref:MarR family winged helix-turn-helix transcriptional regulator n=1 Tax=Aerococcaceae bacterium zg-1292 TaxID=2774330 RepID=UPI004063071E|nr:MarR family transcriptional regulator [Aerococcaceae bacterium zg-BR9]
MLHVGFQIRDVSLALDKYLTQLAIKHDAENLDGPQGAVLFFLHTHRGVEIVQKHIEQFLSIQKSAASGLIKRMEKNGFISVQPHPNDKRYKLIAITELGEQKYETIIDFLATTEDLITDGISSQDLALFKKVLQKIKKNVCSIEHQE